MTLPDDGGTEVVNVIVPAGVVLEISGDVNATLVDHFAPTSFVEIREEMPAVMELPQRVTDVIEVVAGDIVGPAGAQGEKGEPGVQGAPGLPGPPGPVGPFAPTYEQHFAIPAKTWVIVHGMDTYPVVTTVDLNGEEISGTVTTPDRNTVVVEFDVAFAGSARLKA